MINNIKVKDLSRSELLESKYNLGIFSLGYEPRCTFLSSLVNSDNIDQKLLLSYTESSLEPSHKLNKLIFNKLGYNDKLDLSHSNITDVYQSILSKIEEVSTIDQPLKILIDYSSMSRNWYAAILNFFLNYYEHPVHITMVYSCAEYPLNDGFLDFELGDVRVLPGCQGSSITKRKKAGIFMLGFDRIGPLSFYNLLEPDLSYGIIASPGSLPNYESKAREINNQFIQHHLAQGDKLMCSPISSVSQTFENLCQLIQPIKEQYNVSIIQFGPKPHILASTLAGLNFSNVSCIYSEYQRTKSYNVQPSGDLVITAIEKGLVN